LFNKSDCSPLQVLFKAKALRVEKEVNFNVRAQDLVTSQCTNTRNSESDWNRIGLGPNIYTDAAWKGVASPLKAGLFQKERAGLGIHFDWNKEDHYVIYVQAVSLAESALQAEAQALELAAQIGKILQVQKPNFLTDSQIIADALTRSNPTNYPGHWRIRPNLCQFLHHLQGIQARVYKIKRENNIVAHRNAQEAINSHSTGACTFNCTGTRHPSELCPVKAVISNLNVQSSTLISVTCQ
jgi:ribonuclease HI